MEHLKEVIEAVSVAAEKFGVGFTGFSVLIIGIVFAFKFPELVKAISTFVNDYRKTSAEIKKMQKLLDLEIETKRREICGGEKKETTNGSA
ncbi:hypothetical protein FMN63_24940 [Stappia sp. BW2]|uniref:hypothetical protein n=1 Tax=Stappia sp. BW2 TaxID=2592622 RepID=UPI0011DEF4B7|nr:hypothetical protein [Stappia sp. BW2]TYC65633.1 hypothetical protein FMN63_24940 [Stappia sp. BW2]